MKKSYFVKGFVIAAFIFAACCCANMVWRATADETVKDLDSYTTALSIDWTQAAQLPLTGKFTKSFDVTGTGDRSVKVYIADNASVRSYFTVVAVPDGVDTWKYLEDQGWIALADKKGEGLFILEPGTKGWGSAAEETVYVNKAMAFARSGYNAKGIGVFSTYGEFYFVGYDKGAAPLEAYAAQNPTFIISQAYVGGKGIGQASLDQYGAVKYDGSNTSGYDPLIKSFDETLAKCGLTQIARKDVAVPTWFDGYASNDYSLQYWGNANDCSETPAAANIYYQKKDSDALQTLFANSQLESDATHGISQVKVSSEDVTASDIYSFLSIYTRYDNTFAYSNALAYRLDYTAARVTAQYQAKTQGIAETINAAAGSRAISVDLYGAVDKSISGHGTVKVGVFAFKDDNGDGKRDPREYIIYTPKGYDGKKLPVLFVWPGNTQSDSIFLDSTQWWQVADKNGFVAVIVCESYSNAVAITHIDSEQYYYAMMALLKQKFDGKDTTLDFTRVYCTGQSLGSMTTQKFAITHPEFFAAAASTSGTASVLMTSVDVSSDKAIPDYLETGQSDLNTGVTSLVPNLFNNENLQDWAKYMLNVNSLDKTIASYGKHEFLNSRYDVYSWNNKQGIAVVKWGQTMLRPHNCYPGEMPLLWDFVSHFSSKTNDDGTVTRYYSASAFAKDDAVILGSDTPVSGDSSNSGSGGSCNAGFGLLSLLAIPFLFRRKK
jgi:hypothetical protein